MVKVCSRKCGYGHSFAPDPNPQKLEYHDYSHFIDRKMEAQEITQAEVKLESQPQMSDCRILVPWALFYSIYWAPTVYQVVWKGGQHSWSLACPVLGCHGDLPLAWVGRSRHVFSSSSDGCKFEVKA